MTDRTGSSGREAGLAREDRGTEPGVVRLPPSPVSIATGFAGIGAACAVVAYFMGSARSIEFQVMMLLCALVGSMAFWLLVVERVHLNPSTGLDFSAPRPFGETLVTTKVKLIGLYATWAVICLMYYTIHTYRQPEYELYFTVLVIFGPVIFAGSAIYVFFVDRFMRDPRDTLWHAGQWVLRGEGTDPAMLREHVRVWAIKGFFLALMFAGTPGQLSYVTDTSVAQILADPVSAALWAIEVMFLFDVTFALIGYVTTSRLLDAHIRSANPYLSAWVFALICYAPFIVMGTHGPLDYRDGMTWVGWLKDYGILQAVWGAALVLLAVFYAWATVIFGLRFSNLTHRGILTNGPFRYFKHPAYLSKNLFWWMVFLPFLSLDGAGEALRNCMLLLLVNFIYFMRGRSEEWHLMEDPDYQAYARWIARHGMVARLRRAVSGRA